MKKKHVYYCRLVLDNGLRESNQHTLAHKNKFLVCTGPAWTRLQSWGKNAGLAI